jgi:hypothetical protein
VYDRLDPIRSVSSDVVRSERENERFGKNAFGFTLTICELGSTEGRPNSFSIVRRSDYRFPFLFIYLFILSFL